MQSCRSMSRWLLFHRFEGETSRVTVVHVCVRDGGNSNDYWRQCNASLARQKLQKPVTLGDLFVPSSITNEDARETTKAVILLFYW